MEVTVDETWDETINKLSETLSELSLTERNDEKAKLSEVNKVKSRLIIRYFEKKCWRCDKELPRKYSKRMKILAKRLSFKEAENDKKPCENKMEMSNS